VGIQCDMSTILCDSCLLLFNGSEPSGADLEHHKSIHQLKAAAQKNCKICMILSERVANAKENRTNASIRSGYSKSFLTDQAPSDAFSLSFSVFPPTPEALAGHDRYGIRFDNLAVFWVIPEANVVWPAYSPSSYVQLILHLARSQLFFCKTRTRFEHRFPSEFGPRQQVDRSM
jgi:hypothetical protein